MRGSPVRLLAAPSPSEGSGNDRGSCPTEVGQDPDAGRWPVCPSGRQDLNLRPLDPQSSALPSCATSRCGSRGGPRDHAGQPYPMGAVTADGRGRPGAGEVRSGQEVPAAGSRTAAVPAASSGASPRAGGSAGRGRARFGIVALPERVPVARKSGEAESSTILFEQEGVLGVRTQAVREPADGRQPRAPLVPRISSVGATRWSSPAPPGVSSRSRRRRAARRPTSWLALSTVVSHR